MCGSGVFEGIGASVGCLGDPNVVWASSYCQFLFSELVGGEVSLLSVRLLPGFGCVSRMECVRIARGSCLSGHLVLRDSRAVSGGWPCGGVWSEIVSCGAQRGSGRFWGHPGCVGAVEECSGGL